jgi:uncharacterized protein YbjT (DUF2867 family)
MLRVVVGDVTRSDTLTAAVDGVDAIVFTHGSDGGGKAGAERADYGGVRNVLAALGDRSVRIGPMTRVVRQNLATAVWATGNRNRGLWSAIIHPEQDAGCLGHPLRLPASTQDTEQSAWRAVASAKAGSNPT